MEDKMKRRRKVKLMYYRKINGFETQDEIAKALGISKVSYSLKKNGNREFTESEINKMLRLFKVNYEDIFLPSTKQNVENNNNYQKNQTNC